MQVSTLRPGLLVALSTRLVGNVSYETRDLEQDHVTPSGERQARWETERTISIPAEHEDAVKSRSKARSLITAVCSQSSFGLLCPEAEAGKLYLAVDEAQALAAEFNQRAEITRLQVFVIIGRVAQDDVQAVRAINSEVRDLMDAMERGLQTLDVSMVREAANKARNLGAMLSPDASSKVSEAIKVARSAARQIVKAAETGAAEIDQAVLTKIRHARTGFLDLEDGSELLAPETTARAIDLEETEAPQAPEIAERMYDGAFEDQPAVNMPATTVRVPELEVEE